MQNSKIGSRRSPKKKSLTTTPTHDKKSRHNKTQSLSLKISLQFTQNHGRLRRHKLGLITAAAATNSIETIINSPPQKLDRHLRSRPRKTLLHRSRRRNNDETAPKLQHLPQPPKRHRFASASIGLRGDTLAQVLYSSNLHFLKRHPPRLGLERRRELPHPRLRLRRVVRVRDLNPQPPRQAGRLGLPPAHVVLAGLLRPTLPSPPLAVVPLFLQTTRRSRLHPSPPPGTPRL